MKVPMRQEELILLIDSLAPINNAFRREKNAIKKVEHMWELGLRLSDYIRRNKLTLDALLYSIYDPHATIKRSNITRSLGSYSYRVYHFFKKKNDIRKLLRNLESHNTLIEALPLLTNKKYTPHVNKEDILSIVNSQESVKRKIDRLNSIKQSILPTRTLIISPKQMYSNEKQFLQSMIKYMGELYKEPELATKMGQFEFGLSDINYREQLTSILMAIASDAFLGKIKLYAEGEIKDELKGLYGVAISSNENRARFRKWVLSSNKLLWLAEAIHALTNNDDFRFFRKKIGEDKRTIS